MDREMQEIWRELERLKRELANKADANPFTAATTTLTNKKQGTPPQVRGLTLTNGIGCIVAKWDFPLLGDLKRFEIQVATESSFLSPTQTIATLNTTHTWSDLDTDSTWWVRVRAVNIIGKEGAWSPSANNTTGLADTHDLESEAATAFASVKKSGGFYPASWTVGSGQSQEYDVARLSVTFGETADIEVASTWQFYLIIKDRDTASALLYMDDVLYGRSDRKQGNADESLTLSGTTQANIPNVPAGSHEFKLRFRMADTRNDGESSTLTPDEAELQVFRSKR